MDSDSELKLISLISQIREYDDAVGIYDSLDANIYKLIPKIISHVVSMDLESQPRPESKLMSLVTEAIDLFDSMDYDSMPDPLWDLIVEVDEYISEEEPHRRFRDELVRETLDLKPEPEFVSLIRQIVSVVYSMDAKEFLVVCPQEEVCLKEGKFHLLGREERSPEPKHDCFFGKYIFKGGDEVSYLSCKGCKGEYHDEFEKVLFEIKHPLHPKHSLQLVWLNWRSQTRECYCCDEDLLKVFYYCSACDFAMNIACAEKPPLLSRDHPKWHEHTLALFPSMVSLPCNLCGLAHSSCPFYICPPCDFVAHQECLSLPRVIRICRHPHRISFNKSFGQGKLWTCGVCRKKIDNDYGSYTCTKDDCGYAAHSKCATQKNVWDGIDLEGTPEEIEEEDVEPFVRIADGIIQHFSHKHHHLRLDDNKCKDYDEDKLCQACITPIYVGNSYTCEQCEFVLHEKCASISRKIYHPTHPHPLRVALAGENVDMLDLKNKCSICYGYITAGFFYDCGEEKCDFRLDMSCALLSEPLTHRSHKHPLFLTSKPGEERQCSLCPTDGEEYGFYSNTREETFNCIECVNFSLCFECASVPVKVRYKHDSHILTLCHGEAKRTLKYWCEVCEEQIMEKRFYMCVKNCCVTLHVECLIGEDLHIKPGSSVFFKEQEISVLPNNHTMSRPVCFRCEKRCPQKIVFRFSGSIFCSLWCVDTDL